MPGYDLVPSPKDDLGRDGNMDGSEREYVQTPVPTSRPTLDVGAGEAFMRYTTRDLGGSYLEALSLSACDLERVIDVRHSGACCWPKVVRPRCSCGPTARY